MGNHDSIHSSLISTARRGLSMLSVLFLAIFLGERAGAAPDPSTNINIENANIDVKDSEDQAGDYRLKGRRTTTPSPAQLLGINDWATGDYGLKSTLLRAGMRRTTTMKPCWPNCDYRAGDYRLRRTTTISPAQKLGINDWALNGNRILGPGKRSSFSAVVPEVGYYENADSRPPPTPRPDPGRWNVITDCAPNSKFYNEKYKKKCLCAPQGNQADCSSNDYADVVYRRNKVSMDCEPNSDFWDDKYKGMCLCAPDGKSAMCQ